MPTATFPRCCPRHETARVAAQTRRTGLLDPPFLGERRCCMSPACEVIPVIKSAG